VLHYADCVALLRDRRFRQAGMDHLTAQGIADGPLAEMWRATILNVEGADHTRLRRLVSSAFTRSVVERLRPRMRSLVHHLVDTFAPLGACEFMSAFADHYPPRVMFDLLGIPEPDQDRFLQLGKDLALMLSFSVAEHRERIETALADLNEVTDRLCAERRLHPGEDLLSGLVAAADGDDRLTTQELRSMVATMVVAGQDSTRNQLGMALWTFTHHPTQWTLLAHRPDLAERAVEEIMRVSPTVPVIWRVANDDVAHRELTIPAGTRLWLMIGAAHREPATFGEDSFDILLDRPAQLSFGHGVHYCLGAVLARAEMTEALPILASRLRGLELAGDPVFRPELSGFVGPERLPIRFDVRLGVDTVRDPC
jgi:cytochrome P450